MEHENNDQNGIRPEDLALYHLYKMMGGTESFFGGSSEDTNSVKASKRPIFVKPSKSEIGKRITDEVLMDLKIVLETSKDVNDFLKVI
jgi:hypothetical protein